MRRVILTWISWKSTTLKRIADHHVENERYTSAVAVHFVNIVSPQPPSRPRATVTPQRLTKEQEKGKPHMCPVCHRRYKTSASLKAHTTQYHPGETTTPQPPPQPPVAVRVPVTTTQPPPSDESTAQPSDPKRPAKRNPYCDFCLGDDTINKKTNKHERMVSCADCGRSGKLY